MKQITVLIVDDHRLVRDGIRSLLELTDDIEVVGEAENGREAMNRVKEKTPDVVLMDMAMPIMNGLEATRRVRREFPEIKILALTQYDDSEYVIPVIEAGASGFVTKMAAFSELAAAIKAVYKGESYLSPSAAAVLIQDHQVRTSESGGKDPYDRLTDREREVFKLVAEGKTAREIAAMLFVSPKTVESYKTSLMNKLNIHTKTDLIKFAVRKRIITL